MHIKADLTWLDGGKGWHISNYCGTDYNVPLWRWVAYRIGQRLVALLEDWLDQHEHENLVARAEEVEREIRTRERIAEIEQELAWHNERTGATLSTWKRQQLEHELYLLRLED